MTIGWRVGRYSKPTTGMRQSRPAEVLGEREMMGVGAEELDGELAAQCDFDLGQDWVRFTDDPHGYAEVLVP